MYPETDPPPHPADDASRPADEEAPAPREEDDAGAEDVPEQPPAAAAPGGTGDSEPPLELPADSETQAPESAELVFDAADAESEVPATAEPEVAPPTDPGPGDAEPVSRNRVIAGSPEARAKAPGWGAKVPSSEAASRLSQRKSIGGKRDGKEKPRKKRVKLWDYGKQKAIMWGVLLLMQVVIIVAYRLASFFWSDLSWPATVEANILIFIPLLLGFAAIGVGVSAPPGGRGFLLVVLSLAPWAYLVLIKTGSMGDVYPLVPTALHGVRVFPFIGLLLLLIAPSTGIWMLRRLFPQRWTLRFANLLGLVFIALYGALLLYLPQLLYGAEPQAVLDGLRTRTSEIYMGIPLGAVFFLGFPALLAVGHVIDLFIGLKAIPRACVYLAWLGILLLVADFGYTAVRQTMAAFEDDARTLDTGTQMDMEDLPVGIFPEDVEGGEIIGQDAEGRYQIRRYTDQLDRAVPRAIVHIILLFTFLLAGFGLLAAGTVDLGMLALRVPQEQPMRAGRVGAAAKGQPATIAATTPEPPSMTPELEAVQARAKAQGVPFVDLRTSVERIPPEALQAVPAAVATSQRCVPLLTGEGWVLLAVETVPDEAATVALQDALGVDVKFALALGDALDWALATLYPDA